MEIGYAVATGELVDEADVASDRVDESDSSDESRALDGIRRTLDDAECRQFATNQEHALLVLAVGDTVAIARAHPEIYVPHRPGAEVNEADAVSFSVRAAVFDLAARLHLSEQTVHSHLHIADTLQTRLPLLRDVFVAGLAPYLQVRAAVEASGTVSDPDAVARYDAEASDAACRLAPGAFQRRMKRLAQQLATEPLQVRHDRAHAERRVEYDPAADGMAWLHLYVAAVDAVRIDARLSRTATRLRHEDGQTKTKAQLRADAAVAWLAGDGTPTAAIVRPYLLVDPDGIGQLEGYGQVDPARSGRALRDCPSFGRLYTDPLRPARLTLDRRAYRPSRAQREWLTLRYSLDADATDYTSVDAEVDHVREWQDGGSTDIENLLPLKPRLHRLKSTTGITITARPGGGIRVTTPTGYDSHPPPGGTGSAPGRLDAPPGYTDALPDYTDAPPGYTDAPPGYVDAPPGFTDRRPTEDTDGPPF